MAVLAVRTATVRFPFSRAVTDYKKNVCKENVQLYLNLEI